MADLERREKKDWKFNAVISLCLVSLVLSWENFKPRNVDFFGNPILVRAEKNDENQSNDSDLYAIDDIRFNHQTFPSGFGVAGKVDIDELNSAFYLNIINDWMAKEKEKPIDSVFFITISPNNQLKNLDTLTIKTTVTDANTGEILNVFESEVSENINRITFRLPNMQIAELLVSVELKDENNEKVDNESGVTLARVFFGFLPPETTIESSQSIEKSLEKISVDGEFTKAKDFDIKKSKLESNFELNSLDLGGKNKIQFPLSDDKSTIGQITTIKIPLQNYTEKSLVRFAIKDSFFNDDFEFLNSRVFLVQKKADGSLVDLQPVTMEIENYNSEEFAKNNSIQLPKPNKDSEYYLVLEYVLDNNNKDTMMLLSVE